MSVRLISQRELFPEHFTTATEQAGAYCGQPDPGTGNDGSLRPVADNTIEDFDYDGTTDSDGNVGGTTLIDSALSIFGNDYFIGGTVTVGAETSTVTDFAQSTGTLTVSPAFSAQVATSTAYTLKVEFEDRSFRMELIASADPGDATFKWSHDGGSTYFGRNNPNQATWLAEKGTAALDAKGTAPALIRQLADGRWIMFYGRASATGVLCCKSVDRHGLTWGTPVLITADSYMATGAIIIKYGSNTGRIIVATLYYHTYYSDDDGDTWTQLSSGAATTATAQGELLELMNGSILRVVTSLDTTNLYSYLSVDGGSTWSTAVLIDSGATANNPPSAKQLIDGTILCAYRQTGAINLRRSTDGGATWGSEIVIFAFANDFTRPRLEVDIDGSVYCVADEDSVGISFSRSADGGLTWAAKALVTATVTGYPSISLMNGHELVCSHVSGPDILYLIRRGMWELYSANACPCAALVTPQHLMCCSISWYGGEGDAGDVWTWTAEYTSGADNLIASSPEQSWRSVQDNITCTILIDTGTTRRALIDSIAVFGCNLRTFTFKMNATNDFSSPSIDETVTLDVATGAIDEVSGNAVNDASLLASYDDHELKGLIFRATSGTDDGKSWDVLDNVGSYILLDISAATSLAIGNSFVLYSKRGSHSFTNATVYRYIQIGIAAQETPEGFYEIGTAVMGRALDLSEAFGIEYDMTVKSGARYVRTDRAAIIETRYHDPQRLYQVTWPASAATKKEVEYLLDYVQGGDIALVIDTTYPLDCRLVKPSEEVPYSHLLDSFYRFGIIFEEIL